MRALVTGGSGFLGHHLARTLLDKTDWNVTILDRASNRFGLQRLKELEILNSKRLSLIRSDFTDLSFISMMTDPEDFDFIFHLGGKTSVNESLLAPDSYISSNVIGTQKMLDFASRQNRPVSFIYISTNEVFGPGEKGKGFKEWSSYNSQSIYAATKAAGEELVLAYSVQFGLPVLVVHTMNVFGEREAPEKFIPQIIKSILNDKPIPIYYQEESGVGGRTYLYVHSFSNALLFLSQAILNGTLQSHREKINIAGEEFLTNDGLALKVAQIMGRRAKMEPVDYYNDHPGHIVNTALDISKLLAIGWKPETSFDEGLDRTVSWWSANPNWPEK